MSEIEYIEHCLRYVWDEDELRREGLQLLAEVDRLRAIVEPYEAWAERAGLSLAELVRVALEEWREREPACFHVGGEE